ncbi:MAG: PEP/pyruvate-binding domain-containing protein [Woeseiaceae bacterium]|nr:PEP/pyruvate-binding domain-containing protein [Woeseiaceae bacterium]
MCLVGLPAGAAPLDQPTPETLDEARRIVQEMLQSQRGPYSRIRWYCRDGSVLPPIPYACTERGGGLQYAEYSPARQRLAVLGWSVGTIFAPLTFDELFHSQERQQRLREIPLERYLIDIDNGWVLRRAKNYRGRVQAEDEQAAGRRLLTELVTDERWALDNFLLVREAVRTIPHGEDTDLARQVRRQAVTLAELDATAERWRAEIHADPNAGTAGRLRSWVALHKREDVRELAANIADSLDLLYGATGRQQRLGYALAKLGSGDAAAAFRIGITDAMQQQSGDRLAPLCGALAQARSETFAALQPTERVALIDALGEIETEVQLAFTDGPPASRYTRAELLAAARALLDCAFASGLLSQDEVLAAGQDLEELPPALSLGAYRNAIARLKRVPGWAAGTVRHTFAEALMRYSALDPRAGRFSDDLLRSSPMWVLGDVLKALSRDLDRVSGSVVEIAGEATGSAVALNGGVARGALRLYPTLESLEGASLTRSDVVVIPETIAELPPVAGILTLGEGNALSHVQLLARNFGIPNVAIGYDTLSQLEALDGRPVLLVVSGSGDVLLQAEAPGAAAAAPQALQNVVVPQPDLEQTGLLSLPEIGRELSGRVVGPKAANLGELNRLFPGRVAPAIAIPFGVYAAHLDAAGLTARIADAFAMRRAGDIDDVALSERLAAVRRDIVAVSLDDATRTSAVALMQAQFGEPGTYGVFVRSDTNVEDLPQFTGAGLNETVPHLVDPAAQLAAVPRVWASVLSPRALAWRSSVLAEPERIYASVLLMKSVAATKSGVLVTTNLYDRGRAALTVSTAWGVGGAVAGEAAETVVVYDDTVELISAAKTPYQRRLAQAGGVDWVPAPSGRVLTPDEIEVLRQLAIDVGERYQPVDDEDGRQRPWDIEFGFVDGELTLFQIRPLVERGGQSAEALLGELRPATLNREEDTLTIALDQVPQP